MSLDPSIYSQVGRVNVGEGISNIINQQRQLEDANLDRQNKLAAMAYQQQAMQQAQSQKRNQELNMWLSSAVQSGRPIEQVLPEAIAKGQEIGVMPEATTRHVQSVYGATTPQARSDVAFTQAYPDLVAKQRAESMFARTQAMPEILTLLKSAGIEPSSPEGQTIIKQKLAPEGKWQVVQTETGLMQVNPATGETRSLGLVAPKKETPVNWATLQTENGIVQVNPQTGEIRSLGVKAPPKAGQGAISATQHIADAKESNALLDQVEKVGPIATGSAVGNVRDILAGSIGQATEGAKAAAQMKVLGASLTAKVPKMSGPQSDKDVAMYKEAAGNIGNPNVPWELKKAAIETIREINNRQLSYGNDISGQPSFSKTTSGATTSGW